MKWTKMIYDLRTREMMEKNLCIWSKLPFLLTKFRFKYGTISNQHGPSNTLFFNMFLGYTSTTTRRLISRLPDGMAWGRCASGWGIINNFYPKFHTYQKNHGHFFSVGFWRYCCLEIFGICSPKVWKGWDELGHYCTHLIWNILLVAIRISVA